jgi:hypothetical protein
LCVVADEQKKLKIVKIVTAKNEKKAGLGVGGVGGVGKVRVKKLRTGETSRERGKRKDTTREANKKNRIRQMQVLTAYSNNTPDDNKDHVHVCGKTDRE